MINIYKHAFTFWHYPGWYGGTTVCQTSNQKVRGSTPALLHHNLGLLVHNSVPLSPRSITWYWCKNRECNDRLCKRRGLALITLSVCSLTAQDCRNGDEHWTCSHKAVKGHSWLMNHFTFIPRQWHDKKYHRQQHRHLSYRFFSSSLCVERMLR